LDVDGPGLVVDVAPEELVPGDNEPVVESAAAE
jgi:hypothetical protein